MDPVTNRSSTRSTEITVTLTVGVSSDCTIHCSDPSRAPTLGHRRLLITTIFMFVARREVEQRRLAGNACL